MTRRDRGRPLHRPSTPGATSPANALARAHDPGAGQLPQPRVPPRAAGADPAGAGVVLDLARPDVRRRRAARPGRLPRAGAGDLPGDGRRRDHLASASSTTCTTSPTGRRTTTRTRWAWPWSRPPARRGSGSPCWTPATSSRVRRAARGRAGRYADRDADAWAERVAGLDTRPRAPASGGVVVGAAVHSVRAVPRRADADRGRLGCAARSAAARPPLRAGGGEPGLRGGVRAHPHRGAGRSTASSAR